MDNILLIDDEPRILHSLKLALFKEGFNLHFAKSGKEALEIIKDHEISVVISDHKMAGLSGVDLLTKVKKISPYTIRILLTGECDLECTLKSINEAHVYLYIQKPYSGNQLRETLKNAVRRYHETKIIGDVNKGNINIIQAIQRFVLNKIEPTTDIVLLNGLKPGMKLMSDLKADTGLLLAKTGHIVTSRDLQVIKTYPVSAEIAVKTA